MAMDDSERKMISAWVAAWRRAGPELERLRREDLRNTDTQRSLENLAGAFESCRLHHKPLPTSGLIEQQRWFQRIAKGKAE
jgi:hypothetical protein